EFSQRLIIFRDGCLELRPGRLIVCQTGFAIALRLQCFGLKLVFAAAFFVFNSSERALLAGLVGLANSNFARAEAAFVSRLRALEIAFDLGELFVESRLPFFDFLIAMLADARAAQAEIVIQFLLSFSKIANGLLQLLQQFDCLVCAQMATHSRS